MEKHTYEQVAFLGIGVPEIILMLMFVGVPGLIILMCIRLGKRSDASTDPSTTPPVLAEKPQMETAPNVATVDDEHVYEQKAIEAEAAA